FLLLVRVGAPPPLPPLKLLLQFQLTNLVNFVEGFLNLVFAQARPDQVEDVPGDPVSGRARLAGKGAIGRERVRQHGITSVFMGLAHRRWPCRDRPGRGGRPPVPRPSWLLWL